MTTYAEYYGAVFPDVDAVSENADPYGPNGDDLQGTLVAFESPAVDLDSIVLVAGDHYVGRGIRIEIDSDQDLSGKHLILAAERDDVVRFSVRSAILGPQGAHYASLEPPSTETCQWYPALYDAVLRIEHADGQEETIWQGSIRVTAFNTPPTT